MVRVICSALLMLLVQASGMAFAEEPNPSSPKPLAGDLSKLPKVRGKVVQSLGHLNSYLPPMVGAEFELDFTTLAELDKLTFKPVRADAATDFYIPLAIDIVSNEKGSVSQVVPLSVETLKTFGNGAFDSMRLVSRSANGTSPTVKVDVTNLPGRGDPNFVQIWVMVEDDVINGVVLIEGKVVAPAPNSVPLQDTSETKINGKDPIEIAIAHLRERKTNLTQHDVEKATASRYCPPQSTVYQWCVVIPARAGSKVDGLWIALPEKGTPWRLNPETLEKLE